MLETSFPAWQWSTSSGTELWRHPAVAPLPWSLSIVSSSYPLPKDHGQSLSGCWWGYYLLLILHSCLPYWQQSELLGSCFLEVLWKSQHIFQPTVAWLSGNPWPEHPPQGRCGWTWVHLMSVSHMLTMHGRPDWLSHHINPIALHHTSVLHTHGLLSEFLLVLQIQNVLLSALKFQWILLFSYWWEWDIFAYS